MGTREGSGFSTDDVSTTGLEFAGVTPRAPHGLGGMGRDLFGNGRLHAAVGAHGGLLQVSYWGRQHLGASSFFKGDPGTAWVKLFRLHAVIGGKRYYLTLNDTDLFPFGYRSRCEVEGVAFTHELLLLPDALVQHVTVTHNPGKLPVQIEMLHQEGCAAVNLANRTWSDFVFERERNALVASCRDRNPHVYRGGDSLAQARLREIGCSVHDAPDAITWFGLGCDLPLTARRGYHARSKHYLVSEPAGGQSAAYFLAIAANRAALDRRLAELAAGVHAECDRLVADYERGLEDEPQVSTGDRVLDSFFMQQPQVLRAIELPDRPGAFKATLAGYFLWGWDGMMPALPLVLANLPDKAADVLRFWSQVCHPQVGIPLQLTTGLQPRLNNAFPAQCQFIASLYHVVVITGNLELAKTLQPTCEFILDQCRKDEVSGSGLVRGSSLWPDFPEAMGENGHDISSLNNSLLYQGLRVMEYFYGQFGNPDRAGECRAWAERLRANFVKYLFDEEKGYFISSCSSKDFSPRQHYAAQVIFWLTPFARDLVSHAPERIASFMDEHLRSAKCLLSLPRWDTAWMADGNQLGASFPAADYFYLGVHKMIGDAKGLDAWLGDVEWFWRRHTAPEAFTPETENEYLMGPDNQGCKQTQCCSTWYASFFFSLAGLDFDHEGIAFTAWGERPVSIRNLRLRGASLDIAVNGTGSRMGSLLLNGKPLPAGTNKVPWRLLDGRAVIELIRRPGGTVPRIAVPAASRCRPIDR